MINRHEKPEEVTHPDVERGCRGPAKDATIFVAKWFEKLYSDAGERLLRPIEIQLNSVQNQLVRIQTCQQEEFKFTQGAAKDSCADLRRIGAAQQQLASSVCNIDKQLQSLIVQNELLENISKENRILTQDHYQQCIIEPMVRSLFPIFDEVEEAKQRFQEAGKMNGTAVYEVLDAILIHLLQLLSTYQVTQIKHNPNVKFDPKLMRPVKIISTEDRLLNSYVAGSLRTGFRWRQDKVLRPESVAVYRYEPSFSINLNKSERDLS